MTKMKVILAIALVALTGLSPAARAETKYPTGPITWIVPFPAGNVTDSFARVVAKGLTTRLGQAVIVDNRPGAAGIIGTQTVAQARPDGYTMLYASSGPMATFVSLYKHLSYDPLKSFALVNGMASNPLILVVNASKPYKTLDEFIAYLKAHPGEVNFGSPGIGTGSHLTGELFQAATGTKMRHIPYKDAASLYSDLLSGTIDAVFDYIPVMRPQIQAGTVIPLGVTREERVKSFPSIPTFKERGYDIVLATWSSVAMPSGTPQEIVDKMSAAIQDVMKSPEIDQFQTDNDQGSLADLGAVKMRDYLTSEISRYKVLIGESGIHVN